MNFSIKRILVPIDLSETSLNALDTAVALAMKHQAALIILNVMETTFDSLSEESGFLSLSSLTNSSDVLSALAGKIHNANGIQPKIVQQEGNVSETIIKISIEHHTDVIVMGTHGASGFRDGFVGSNTYNVIKYSACPVLTIPVKGKFTSFRKVLFPIRPVAGALVRFDVVSCFLSANPLLEVLGLSTRQMEKEVNVLDKILDEIRPQIEADKVRTKVIWGNGNMIADDVLHYAQQTNPELIILTSLLDVTTKPNFIGPHSQKIIHGAKAPVLSIKKIGVPALA